MPTIPFLVEAFLLIEQPRQRLGDWIRALTPLDAPNVPRPEALIAYYDPTCDQALINVHYNESELGAERLRFLVEIALAAEIGMVQPAELSEGERARFLAERLPRCTVRVTHKSDAAGALTELVKLIKDQRRPPSIAERRSMPAIPPPIPQRAMGPPPCHLTAGFGPRPEARGDTDDPVMLVNARGTRDNLRKLEREDATTPNYLSARDRATTVEMPPEVTAQLSAHSRVDVMPRKHARAESPGRDPFIPTGAAHAGIIYARFLRGGRWLPVRVGALSLKGAALLTGALPRLQDRVDIALSFDSQRALVRGTVEKVSTMREAQQTGAATFTVAFVLDDASRSQLTKLLTAARNAKVTIKPAPPRATRRFPVEWPVTLGTQRGGVKATVLDVSTGGMFVRPTVVLDAGATVSFSVVLDDATGPITGTARVVRRITDQTARACGLLPGFGLGIVEMAEADRMRWLGFLARIERRAEKRVLIGADASRLVELQAQLASLGYAVIGGTDPGALVQLANADARPADAVLIDAGWLATDTSASLVESLFSARNVPCVTMNGETRGGTRARQAIDRLLEVVV